MGKHSEQQIKQVSQSLKEKGYRVVVNQSLIPDIIAVDFEKRRIIAVELESFDLKHAKEEYEQFDEVQVVKFPYVSKQLQPYEEQMKVWFTQGYGCTTIAERLLYEFGVNVQPAIVYTHLKGIGLRRTLKEAAKVRRRPKS